jgi:hypothetical protein
MLPFSNGALGPIYRCLVKLCASPGPIWSVPMEGVGRFWVVGFSTRILAIRKFPLQEVRLWEV